MQRHRFIWFCSSGRCLAEGHKIGDQRPSSSRGTGKDLFYLHIYRVRIEPVNRSMAIHGDGCPFYALAANTYRFPLFWHKNPPQAQKCVSINCPKYKTQVVY